MHGSGSSESIASGYGLEGPGIESRWGRDFPHLSGPALRPTQPPVQCIPGLSRGKQRPERNADPSPPSSAVVMKGYSYTSTPPIGCTVCTEPQCLYMGALYLYIYLTCMIRDRKEINFADLEFPWLGQATDSSDKQRSCSSACRFERIKMIYSVMYWLCPPHCLVQIQISSELHCAVYCLLLTPRSKDNSNANEALQHKLLSCRSHTDANSAMYSIPYEQKSGQH